MQYITVPVGTAALNDSIPDAKLGSEVLREAIALFKAGLTGSEVLARLSVQWGRKQVIEAIAMAVGQRNFVDAVVQGALYQPKAT